MAGSRRKKDAAKASGDISSPAGFQITLSPAAAVPTLEPSRQTASLACSAFQILGKREEQQDAFFASAAARFESDGLLAILCDGMGGMDEGGAIANDALGCVRSWFHPGEPGNGSSYEEVAQSLRQLSAGIYAHYRGRGGTTMVIVHILGDALRYWSVGDSDLFLRRYERLYAVNKRQEYRNDLIESALRRGTDVESAFLNPQASALSSYIGAQNASVDGVMYPFRLRSGDTLLLCSDGVSDVLSLDALNEALADSPADACRRLEAAVLSADRPEQDNATAIVLRMC